jgi:hypothetical protein
VPYRTPLPPPRSPAHGSFCPIRRRPNPQLANWRWTTVQRADPDEIVNVFMPAIHGRYAGLPGFIEVQIEATRPSVFGGIIGKAAWPVGVFAVATNAQKLEFPFSMLALDPTACKAIQVSGQGDVNAVGTIQSNSSGEDCPGDPISFSRTGGSEINVGDDIYCRASGPIQDEGSGDMTAHPP